MTKSLLRAALMAVTVGVVLAPVPAFAQRLVIGDGPGDSWEEHHDPSTGDVTYTQAGSPVNADVLRTVVRHRAHSVLVRTAFADLRNNAQGVVSGIKIRTNEGLHRQVWVMKDGSASGSQVALVTPRGRQVRCHGLSKSIDWAGDSISVTVPRSCLSAPRWVQVVNAAGNFATGDMPSYVDVAGKTGYRFSGWSAKIRRG
jgi:hypothetical protein